MRYLKINIELKPKDATKLLYPYIRVIVLLPRKDTEKVTISNNDKDPLPYGFLSLCDTKEV